MSEKKQLNEKDLVNVSGGALKYQEGWHISHIYKDYIKCNVCNKTVDVIMYKEAMWTGYCAICHKAVCALD